MTVQICHHPSLSSLELSLCVPALFSHSVIHSKQFPLFWRGLKETTDTETEEFEISCICGPMLTVSNSRLWRLQLLTHWPVSKIWMSSMTIDIFKVKYYIIYVIYIIIELYPFDYDMHWCKVHDVLCFFSVSRFFLSSTKEGWTWKLNETATASVKIMLDYKPSSLTLTLVTLTVTSNDNSLALGCQGLLKKNCTAIIILYE